MTRSHRTLAFFTIFGLTALASAQAKPELTLATVLERGPALAASLPTIYWFPTGHEGTVVLPTEGGGQAMHRLEAGQPASEPWFTAEHVAAALSMDASKAPRRFPAMTWLDQDTLRLQYDHSIWHWDIGAEDIGAEGIGAEDIGAKDIGAKNIAAKNIGAKEATRVLSWHDPKGALLELSPNDGHAAVRSQHQLFLHDRSGQKHQLSFDGTEDVILGGPAHRSEIGIVKGTFWREDGRFLAFYREDLRQIAKYPYQDVQQMPPTARHGRYPMAGRPHSKVRVLVCDTKTYQVATLEADPDADVYWTNITFGPNDTVYVTIVNRGQDHLELQSFDAKTGKKLATILTEHDREWIEPEHPPQFLNDGKFLWWSRRSGFRNIFLHEPNGKLIRQVTYGNCDVLSLQHLKADESRLYYQASGNDPRQLHLFSVSLTKEDTQQHTTERGSHQVTLSPDAKQAHVFYSNLETFPNARVLDTATNEVQTLPQPNNPLAEFELPKQRFFEVEADDGSVLYGHVALPPNLQPGERAPVIHYVYGGPHAQLVKDQWFGGASTWLQGLAGDGYIVCRLDNRGTPNRGIEFEQSIHRHLGTKEVADQLRAIAWLRQQPFVDPSRIGVHGWSFGGYMTLRLMLLHPTVFACGISGAPVTDWSMYETGYGERYMDSPQENPDGYEESSCLPIAGQLQNPLLIVHGTDDRTVMWSHTLKFVDACVQAGVQLDYFPYPQQLHGLRGPYRKHFLQKLSGFFGRHLRPEDRGGKK